MHTNKLILDRWNFVFLLGESGGGKGTLVHNIQSTWLANLSSTSMGDMFRAKAQSDPQIKELTEKGVLISDDIVLGMFKEFALENSPGLMDGFPRTRSQALDSIKFIKEQGWRVLVIDLKCDIEVIIERLLARGRADDKLDIMYKRNLDHRTLHPHVMAEIKNRSDVFDVITLDGNKPAEVVYTDFLLEILRLVDLLYLYDAKEEAIPFKVHSNETTVNNAMNRWLSQMLIHIQQKIEKTQTP